VLFLYTMVPPTRIELVHMD